MSEEGEGRAPRAAGTGGGSGEAPDFEAALSELEEIVRSLDRDDVELDEALELFEQGLRRLRTATRLLDRAEGRVEELIEEASGELSVVDFEPGGDGGDG